MPKVRCFAGRRGVPAGLLTAGVWSCLLVAGPRRQLASLTNGPRKMQAWSRVVGSFAKGGIGVGCGRRDAAYTDRASLTSRGAKGEIASIPVTNPRGLQ